MENASSNKVSSDGWRTVLSNDSNSASNDGWRTVLSNDFSSQHENYIQPKAPASLSQVPQGALNAVKNFIPDIPRSAYELGKGLIYDPITKTYKNVKEQGIAKGAEIAGKSLLGAGGDILSYPAKKAVDIAVDPMGELQRQGEFIQERPAMAAMNVATALEGGGALTGVKGLTTVGKAINPVNIVGKSISKASDVVLPALARRGMGYQGGMLTKPGALDRATEVSLESLKNGIMPASGDINKALQNAKNLSEKTGKSIDAIRQEVGASVPPSFDVVSLMDEVKNQIEPTLLASDKKILNRVMQDISKEIPGANPYAPYADFMKASKLVQKLQEKGKFKPLAQGSDAVSAEVYQRASGIARKMLDDAVEKAGIQLGKPDLINNYIALKKTYGIAEDAKNVLYNKSGKLAGNNPVGLLNTIVGAGGVAAHNPLLVGAAITSELYKRRPGAFAQAASGVGQIGKGISQVSPYGAIPQYALNALNNKVNEKRSK